jgi:hypothetical protein
MAAHIAQFGTEERFPKGTISLSADSAAGFAAHDAADRDGNYRA